jgi:type IV pilus assembly protein PilM
LWSDKLVFRRTYLGLDICPDGLRAVAVQRRSRHTCLVGGQTLTFSDGVLKPAARELNVLKPELYIENLREVLLPLAKTEERVAVSLPDASGNTFLLDIDAELKSRQQSIDILKWQIKDFMPEGYRDFRLDYQVLAQRESGEQRVMVSTVDNKVLHQYEELMEAAGFNANLIDFHAFQLYNCYRSKTDLGDDFILVAASGKDLILLGFKGRVLDFFRVKKVGYDADNVFREINRSLVAYRRENPGQSRMKIYLHADWLELEVLKQAVQSAFAQDVHMLPQPLLQLKGDVQKLALTGTEMASMAAALGAAERLLDKAI